MATGKQQGDRPGHEGEVGRLAVSPDGKVLASVALMQEHVIRLWSVTGKPLHVLRGHPESVTCIAFSADSKFLVSGGDDSTALLWDVASGKLVAFSARRTPRGVWRGKSGDLALSADGKRLAVRLRGTGGRFPTDLASVRLGRGRGEAPCGPHRPLRSIRRLHTRRQGVPPVSTAPA